MENKVDYKSIYYPPGGMLMWIVVFLELITFGMSIIALLMSSKNNPEQFHASSLYLNATYGAINTVFLLVSGFFMATAVRQFKKNNTEKSLRYIYLTMLGGILFLVLKSIEYMHKIDLGFTLGYDTFFNFYWLLTGFHVIHIVVGLVILLSLQYSIKKSTVMLEDIEAGAAFWHMCDLIWLLLFPVLYLVI